MTEAGNEKLRSALGFAMKAGRLKSGELAAEKALKSGNAYLAAVDGAASEQTKKHWSDMCNNAGVPIVFVEDVGRAIGREAHMVACITDKGFAQMILRSREEKQL
ncbi:MAG: ribosomal L7Ae/L30e/S12e/Gadd45 family protein [Clostridiales bacterium]|nr:ribosomal L7Ae/L30e/S12e/Gadd45 family protein [Clostridiales bacterium]